MTRDRFAVHRSEAGTSLILALAMVTLISVGLVAALGFATASLRTISVVRQQRTTVYAAENGVQTSIQALRYDPTAGTTAVGTPCPSTSLAAVGAQPAASVACQVAQSYSTSGAGTPKYAVLAVGSNASEPGININAATFGPLKVIGPIASNSPANGSIRVSGGTLDMRGYTIDAKGSCTGSITVTTPADNRCASGGTYADPAYPSQPLPDLGSPNPAPVCTTNGGVLQFVPGYYTNTAALENPTYPGNPSCQSGSLYFQPGVYYFDFGVDPSYPDPIWNVTQRVVGGQYKGWNPNQPGSQPQQPNPGNSESVACKTEADGATDGVQFVFGGESQMNVTASGATMELCPDPAPTGTKQQIAIYGQTTGDAIGAELTQVPTTTATQTPSNSWTNPLNTSPIGPSGTTIDGKFAYDAIASGATDSLSLNGYAAPIPLIPAGANVSAVVNIAHSESLASSSSNVSSLTAHIGSPYSGCSVTVPAHTTSTSTVSLVTDTISIPMSSACTAALSNKFSVVYTSVATRYRTFRENLDGIDIVVSYTMPAARAESGCTIVINSCAVVDVGGPAGQAKFVSWGTIYVPLGRVNADVNGASVVNFRRGLIARAVTVPHIPSGTTLSFCLAAGSPCNAPPPSSNLPRVLLLTATVSGNVELRALVQYTDTPAVGTSLQILSWNPIRG